jgi:hypothetical protein
MAESTTKLGPQSWIQLGTAVGVCLGCLAVYSKIASFDTKTTVLELNSTHANETLKEIGETLKEMASKQNGESEKLGNHEGRLAILEDWRKIVDRKLDGK